MNHSNKETDPLISPRTKSKYYFLNKQDESYNGVGSTPSVRDGDGGIVVESGPPEGTTENEFAPRPVIHKRNPSVGGRTLDMGGTSSASKTGVLGIFDKLFGTNGAHKGSSERSGGGGEPAIGSLAKMRKAPVKIEPKVFFANERTFLAWMHLSIILAGASIAILAFAEDTNPLGQLYGIVLLPVSIAFIVYSMYQYTRRAKMIRHRHPGPYEDTTGPVVLGVMLMISIVAQFALKLYSMSHFAHS